MRVRLLSLLLLPPMIAMPAIVRAEERMVEPDDTGMATRVELNTPLRLSIARHLEESSAVGGIAFAARQTQPRRSSGSRNFVQRHPVISGMLIGMAAGSAVAAAAWHSEAAFIGFYSGAGVGALVGWALSR